MVLLYLYIIKLIIVFINKNFMYILLIKNNLIKIFNLKCISSLIIKVSSKKYHHLHSLTSILPKKIYPPAKSM